MEKIRIDYLSGHKDYKVVQHEDMYHFNTDTCLLGEFIKINNGETVLDVGTNNGALLLYVIHKKGIATGIDINQEAIEIAKLTLKENNLEANLIAYDYLQYDFDNKFDVIVSNPPYFDSKDEKEFSQNLSKRLARHESSLTLDQLIKKIANDLKEFGRLYLVYRPNRLKELEKKLNDNNLYINNYQLVYDKRKKEPKTLLVEASFNKKEKNQLEDCYIGG